MAAPRCTGLRTTAILQSRQRLLNARANPAAVTGTGMTPLALACEAGNAEMVRVLLKGTRRSEPDAGQRRDAADDGGAHGQRAGDRSCCSQARAKIDAREKLRGTTALMWAAANSNTDAVRLLIAKGADVNARSATVAPGRKPYLAPPGRERIQEFIDGTGLRGAVVEQTRRTRSAADAAAQRSRRSSASMRRRGRRKARSRSSRRRRRTRSRGDKQWGGLTPLLFAAREGKSKR